MNDYLQIRLLHRDGASARQIARRLGHGRDTVKKALLSSKPPGYTRSRPAACPKLTALHQSAIDQILKEDGSAPKKQRHTASQIFARLRDERGYVGQYDQVRRYVGRHRRRERETHLFLDHPPGCRLECDFGHIHVDYPHGRELTPVLICVWSYSHCPLAIALPSEKTESILYGLVCALEFFDCVPLELWWDNPTTVASLILKGRDRRLNPHYAALASHYRFAPMFCMPAKGQEKSDAERTVYALERRFATPVPRVQDREELNRHLLMCCLKERDRVVRGRSESIGEMFQTDKAHAVELPSRPFDACLQQIRQVDKYQTVLFEQVRYSVPRQVAFECVTVKAYMDQIVIVHKGAVVARHKRSRTPGDQVLEPTHYLATLGRKPAYLDKTRLFAGWQLPAAFMRLREKFRQLYGDRTGTRHYIRVLQLLASHPIEPVVRAIEACQARQMLSAEIIAGKLESFRTCVPGNSPTPDAPDSSVIPQVHVPPPDLRRFDQLLVRHSLQGEESDVQPRQARCGRDVIEAQPQDAAPADHAGRAHASVP